MFGIIDKEVADERACMLFLRDQPFPGNLLIRRVITRSGRSTFPVHGTDDEVSDSDSEVSAQGGEEVERDPTLGTETQGSGKHVTFAPDVVSSSDADDIVELVPSESEL